MSDEVYLRGDETQRLPSFRYTLNNEEADKIIAEGQPVNGRDLDYENFERGESPFNPLEEHRWFCAWCQKCPLEKNISGWNLTLNKMFEDHISAK